jgi:hypothetical protein
MMNIGDTKAGTLVGVDKYGNKFYENLQEELPRMLKSKGREEDGCAAIATVSFWDD